MNIDTKFILVMVLITMMTVLMFKFTIDDYKETIRLKNKYIEANNITIKKQSAMMVNLITRYEKVIKLSKELNDKQKEVIEKLEVKNAILVENNEKLVKQLLRGSE